MSILILVLATFMGGGSLLLFGVFLILGPLHLFPMGWSEPVLLAWDGFLSLTFFVQHSSMLRRGLRARLAKVVPPYTHGALYALVSGMVLTLAVVFWQSSPTLLYALEGVPRWLMRGLSCLVMAGFAWGAVALRCFDPLGLSAIRAQVRGAEPAPQELVVRGPYLWVRHPLYLFSILLIWSCPDVTTDRLLFNLLWSAWIYVGTFFEEADLLGQFGEAYRDYQRRVPRLIPWRLGRRP